MADTFPWFVTFRTPGGKDTVMHEPGFIAVHPDGLTVAVEDDAYSGSISKADAIALAHKIFNTYAREQQLDTPVEVAPFDLRLRQLAELNRTLLSRTPERTLMILIAHVAELTRDVAKLQTMLQASSTAVESIVITEAMLDRAATAFGKSLYGRGDDVDLRDDLRVALEAALGPGFDSGSVKTDTPEKG